MEHPNENPIATILEDHLASSVGAGNRLSMEGLVDVVGFRPVDSVCVVKNNL